MQFKICDNKTLCLDLRDSSKEEIILVLYTISSTCQCIEEAGHKIITKKTNNKILCKNES